MIAGHSAEQQVQQQQQQQQPARPQQQAEAAHLGHTDTWSGVERSKPDQLPVPDAGQRWDQIIEMVFDAMHGSSGALRHQVSSGQVSTHAVLELGSGSNSGSSGLEEKSAGVGLGNGGNCNRISHLSSSGGGGSPAHRMAADDSLDSWQRKSLLQYEDGRCDEEDDDDLHDDRAGGSGNGLQNGWHDYPAVGSKGNGHQQHNGHGHQHLGNGAVKIQLPLPPPERDECKLPKEKWKTLLAFFFVFANWVLTTVSLALVHERMPDRAKSPPLPDILFDLFPAQDWALDVSEILIIISVNMCLLAIFLHRHRFILLRRCFLILGLLYLMRCITMFVTQVPVASTTYFCSPKANSSNPAVVMQRVLQLLSGFGLSINGQHTYCGDYIYSGHTVILTMAYLLIHEYTPRNWWILHWTSFCMSVTGVLMVLLARGHYTVDVLIAYYVTTRVFWIYHTMANNQSLKTAGNSNYLSRLWWFFMFEYFERNIACSVPRLYEWPLPWPRRLVKRDRDS